MTSMKLAFAAITLTALSLFVLHTQYDQTPQMTLSTLPTLKAERGYLYDQKVCGTASTDSLDFISFSNASPVKSRSKVTMDYKFKGQSTGTVSSLKISIIKVFTLYTHTYKDQVDYSPDAESDFSMNLTLPMIPLHATLDVEASLQDADGNELLKICAKLDV